MLTIGTAAPSCDCPADAEEDGHKQMGDHVHEHARWQRGGAAHKIQGNVLLHLVGALTSVPLTCLRTCPLVCPPLLLPWQACFDEVKIALNIDNLEEFNDTFSTREDQNFAIVKHINALNEDAAVLEEKIERARRDRAALVYVKSSSSSASSLSRPLPLQLTPLRHTQLLLCRRQRGPQAHP